MVRDIQTSEKIFGIVGGTATFDVSKIERGEISFTNKKFSKIFFRTGAIKFIKNDLQRTQMLGQYDFPTARSGLSKFRSEMPYFGHFFSNDRPGHMGAPKSISFDYINSSWYILWRYGIKKFWALNKFFTPNWPTLLKGRSLCFLPWIYIYNTVNILAGKITSLVREPILEPNISR